MPYDTADSKKYDNNHSSNHKKFHIHDRNHTDIDKK